MLQETVESAPYKMRTIARLTDLSPALLRAWERRHALLEPLRGPGGHRLYTEDDLQVLLRVKDLIGQGRSIGEIATVGRSKLLDQSAARQPVETEPLPAAGPELRRELDRWSARIVDAALSLDSSAVNRALDEAFARVEAETVVFEMMQPASLKLGDLWVAGKCSVASEHLATGVFVHRLRKLLEAAEPRRSAYAPVIAACFPDEFHQLGALMLSYLMARSGIRVSFLGAALPLEDLEGACDVVRPAAVLLSVTRREVYRAHRKQLLSVLRRRAHSERFLIGGQGAPDRDPAVAELGGRLISTAADRDDMIRTVLGIAREAGPSRL